MTKLCCFFIFFLIIETNFSQTVYTPLYSDIYDFLDRQSIKQNIILNDEVKPYSRNYIASMLAQLESDKTNLNDVEQEGLEFFRQEYAYELKDIQNERWFLFSHNDSLFSLKVSPVAGYGISTTGDNFGHTRWIGVSAFGTYGNWFGASFSIRDKGEFGDNVDKNKQFSPQTGAFIKSAPNGIEYSDVKGSITLDWGWGNVGLIKDYFSWGHGRFGQLIFSEKPPSYPHIRLTLKPADWLRFYYFHGWLNSQVIDSSSIQYEYPGSVQPRIKEAYINKYVAANLFTVTPLPWLDVSVGNSFVYSGDLRPEMFIPFMFFKFLDHNTGRGSVNDGNGTFYFDASVKYPDDFQFYSTLFIDVTEIRNLLDEDFSNTWIGFTLGGKKADLFTPNVDLTIEYTRINPWVYEHKYETTTYKHLDYVLGHWMGQNSDQVRVQLNYRFLRGLKFVVLFERIRKGGLDDIYYAYGGSDEKDLSFLYSPKREDKVFGLSFRYEYMHELILTGDYRLTDISDEDIERTKEFLSGTNHSFALTLYYGM